MKNPPDPPSSRVEVLWSLFERARDLPSTEREAFVRSQTADRSIADEVLSLFGSGEAQATARVAADPGRESAVPSDDKVQSTATEDREHFGVYRRTRLLGQGGQGVVWLAEDTRLGRLVALKVLSTPAAQISPSRIGRLRREAQILARLDHPCICTIYEADFDSQHPYLAMRYIEGETLAALLAQRQPEPAAPLPVMGRAEMLSWLPFFSRVAEALHAAHELGIVHRDVKPGNIMRAQDGSPVVLDFGLARDEESTAVSLTQPGDLFGTLAYMAPEVLLGRSCDRRVDVYALGVTLFETLANRRPFPEATYAQLRRSIEVGDTTCLSALLPAFGPDLGLVIATAIECDPARRYLTAKAFAEDLGRLHLGQAIAARPVGAFVRLRRFLARHPIVATTSGLLLAGLVVVSMLLVRVQRGSVRLQALRDAYAALLTSEDQPGTALYQASEAARMAPHREINDILFQTLDRCWEESRSSFPYVGGSKNGIAASADGLHIAYAQLDGAVLLVAAATGSALSTLRHAAGGPTCARFCGSSRLLTGGLDGCIKLLSVPDGAEHRYWRIHTAAPSGGVQTGVTYIAVAPDGKHAASCGADGTVALFDVDTEPVTLCCRNAGGVGFAAFSPTGAQLVTCNGDLHDGDKTVRLFDARTGATQRTWGPFDGPVRWVDWSPTGDRIVIARDEHRADVCDVATGKVLVSLPHASKVTWAAFVPETQAVVTSSKDGVVVFDLDGTGERKLVDTDFRGEVFRGAFSPDGTRLAVIAWDNTARIYDRKSWQRQHMFRGIMRRSIALCWNATGTRIATGSQGLQTWYAKSRPYLQSLQADEKQVVSAEFSADDRRALTTSIDGRVRIWDWRLSESLVEMTTGSPLHRARFSADGRTVLAIAQNAPSTIFDIHHAGHALGSTPATDGWFAHDGQIVLAGIDGKVRLHEPTSGVLLKTISVHKGTITCGIMHPQRPWLATGGSDRTFRIVDLETSGVVFESKPWSDAVGSSLNEVFSLAFDPSGRRLFASCEDGHVRAIEIDPDFHSYHSEECGTPGSIAVTHDGTLLLVAEMWQGYAGTLDTANMARHYRQPRPVSNRIIRVEMQPRGDLALVASWDGTVSLFEPRTNQLVAVIRASSGKLLDAHFSHDGAHIITAAADGNVRIWPTDPLPTALQYRPARIGAQVAGR